MTGNKEAEEKEANGKKELSCFARNITVASKDEAIEKAKAQISSCTEYADESGDWFAVYCGQGTLDHRVYVKKQAEDPASGVDKEAEKRMVAFKNACKTPWRPVSYKNGMYVSCIIGDGNTPAKKSDVESKLKKAFNNGFCDKNEYTGAIETFLSGEGSFVCCTTGRYGCNAFVYRYSSLIPTTPQELCVQKGGHVESLDKELVYCEGISEEVCSGMSGFKWGDKNYSSVAYYLSSFGGEAYKTITKCWLVK